MLLVLTCMSITNLLSGQNCTQCTIDVACDTVPANPRLCPAVLPTDTAQQYYEADVTFYMPAQFDITTPVSGTVDLTQIDVVGLSGLPAGMSWTAYDYTGAVATTFYPPSNTPASERGCAKICGTPLMPGNYTITVSVLAYVTLGSQSVTQAESFDVPLTIVANPSGNSVFTMSNNQGCDSVSTDFSPILQSGGDPLFTYYWDFGDGVTSTDEFPTHNYTTPGTYVVSCQMDVLQYVLSDVSVNVTNDDWCGDVEEPFIFVCTGNPDIYFRLNDGFSLYDSPTQDNTTSPSWSGLGRVLEGALFTMQFFDEDNVSQHDDMGLTIVNITGAGSYPVATISPNANTQAINGTLSIITQVDTSYIDQDTIYVYAMPGVDTIAYQPEDSICTGDSVTLTTSGGTFYQWYDDTNLLVDATDSVYVAYQTGDYWTTVTSAQGCEESSNVQSVTVVPYPGVLSFFNNANTLTTFSSEPNLQWYMDVAAIPGATSTIYTITQDGNYFLTASNVLGCVTSSDTLFVSYAEPVSIDDGTSGASALQIYPSPNNGSFVVAFETLKSVEIIIVVRDIMGKTVYDENFGPVHGSFAADVLLDGVAPGVYTVNVGAGNHVLHRKVLVK